MQCTMLSSPQPPFAVPPGGWACAEHHDMRAPVCDGGPPGHSLEDRSIDEALPAVHDGVPRNLGHVGAGLEAGHEVLLVGKVGEQDRMETVQRRGHNLQEEQPDGGSRRQQQCAA